MRGPGIPCVLTMNHVLFDQSGKEPRCADAAKMVEKPKVLTGVMERHWWLGETLTV